MAFCFYQLSSCSATDGVVRNGSIAGHQRLFWLTAVNMATAVHAHRFSTRYAPVQPLMLFGHEWRVDAGQTARIMGVGLNNDFWYRHLKKLRPQSVTSRIQPGAVTSSSARGNGTNSGAASLNRASAGCLRV